MQVLVTGGTGFVGTVLCEELADRGHDVTALARNPGEADFEGDVETVQGNVTDYDAIEPHFEGQDAVVNLVALSPLFRPEGGNQRHFEVHLGGTENVVAAAEAHGVDRIVQNSGVHADPDADTAYLQAKGQAEAVVRESDLSWVIVRPSVLFGDGGEFIEFIKTVAPPYLTPLPGGGKQRFQPMWVDDCATVLAEAAGSDEYENEVYEVGGPKVYTLAELAETLHGADGRSVTVVPVPMALADVGLAVLGAVGGPMGRDQAKSLRKDLTVDPNEVDAFGLTEAALRTLENYLGIEAT